MAALPIRLVIADDHPVVVEGLARLFALEPDFEIVGQASNGEAALRLVDEFAPHVLLLDLRMPGMDGLAVLRRMSGVRSSTRTIVLTGAQDDEIHEAIGLGAQGVVLKSMAPGLLVRCIREVHAGHRWIERGCATQTLERMMRREAGRDEMRHALTPRELEIATMVGKGMRNKTVAARMSITEGTAKLHLHHVYRKLNVDGRPGLMRYFQRKGLA